MLRLSWRSLLARKVRLLMSTAAIVLGVAFLAGVLVFSNGLSSTFDNIIAGSTPDGVVRPEGAASFSAGEFGSTDAVLTPATIEELEALPEVERADGSVDGLGMSLLAEDGTLVGGTGAPTLAFNRTGAPNIAGGQILLLEEGRWPTAPGEIALDTNAAENGGYEIGDRVNLLTPVGPLEQRATLVGTAEFNGGGTAGATLLILDTKGAQLLFLGGRDAFTSIALTAAEGVTQQELVDAAAGVLPAGFEAVAGDTVVSESEDAVGQFLGVIETFLLVFAIIAVLVGGFIIVNTFSILVAQRTRELALLRALGASRQQVTRSVLLEAAVMAVVASTVGVLLGWALALGLAALFRAVGLDIAGSALDLTPRAVLISYAVGILVTVVAAYLPSRRAGRVAPVAAMRADLVTPRTSVRRRALIGTVLLAVGALLATAGVLGAPGPDAAWVGAAALVWVLTVAGISSVLGRPVLVSCRALFGRLFGTPGKLAGENALRDPRRTGATASALMIGLALVSTIGVLAASMNESVDDVVDDQFAPDILVQGTNFMPFSTAIGDRFETVDGVGVVSRQQVVLGDLDGERVTVAGQDAALPEVTDFDLVSGREELSGAEAILTRQLADEERLGLGDPVPLAFPAGKRLEVEVVGIIDESPATGEVTVPLELLADAGMTRQDTTLSVLLAPGADADAVHERLDEIAAEVPTIGVYDKAEFAEEIRGQVNQLLYMIYGLLALAIVIAVIGIVNTLGLSVIERTREIGLLRALGMSRPKLRRMVTLESVAIAVLGAVLGMAVGVLVGVLLREVLSEDLTSLGLPLTQLLLFLGVAVVVGVLAAVLPAARASRLNVLEAIATE